MLKTGNETLIKKMRHLRKLIEESRSFLVLADGHKIRPIKFIMQ